MALTNFSLPFGILPQPVHPWGATPASQHTVHQLATNTNNLLYAPQDHQQQNEGAAPPPESDYYKNNPYAPPQQHQQHQQPQSYQYNSNNNNNNNNRRKNAYLPPIPPPGTRNTQYHHQQQQQQQQQQQFSHISTQQQQISHNGAYKGASSVSAAAASASSTRTYGEGSYNRYPAQQQQQNQKTQPPKQQQQQQQPQQQQQYYNSYSATQTRVAASSAAAASSSSTSSSYNTQAQPLNFGSKVESASGAPAIAYGAATAASVGGASVAATAAGGLESLDGADASGSGAYPVRPPGFTRVQAGQGSRTQVHAVLDYDAEEGEEDYYDAEDHGDRVNNNDSSSSKKSPMPTVTPIQGPIFLKNGTVPVVPLFSYPTINNGTFVQIPIWWTALSVALGLDVRGDIIKGVPCIKRFHQLFCPTAGNSYPIDKIERFIDDNKALMRRMYGDFEMNMDPGGPRQTKKRRRRFIDEPDIFLPPGAFPSMVADDDDVDGHEEEAGASYFAKLRNKRQSGGGGGGGQGRNQPNNNKNGPGNPGATGGSSTGRLDACESKIEIVTPYWASNSAGKIRAIVNTQHFEQAIHQEICSKTQTPRCENDCGCEQKYKWHRLLAYDPDNDCKGIFMDWFLFPSCCVCRCNPVN